MHVWAIEVRNKAGDRGGARSHRTLQNMVRNLGFQSKYNGKSLQGVNTILYTSFKKSSWLLCTESIERTQERWRDCSGRHSSNKCQMVAQTIMWAINMEQVGRDKLCSGCSSGVGDGKIMSHYISHKIKGETCNDSDFSN